MKREETRRFYNRLAQEGRKTRGLSCGFAERYDPARMRAQAGFSAQLRVMLYRGLAGSTKPLGSVLDVGCGTFFYHPLLAEHFELVAGLESSGEMLKAGAADLGRESSPPTGLCLGQVEELPFADHSWEAVFSLDTLHHLEHPSALVAEIYRVLKPGGIYLGIEPNLLNPGMFLAHLLPPEERGALKWNWPSRLLALFSPPFPPPALSYYNLSISAGFSSPANRLFPFGARGTPWWGLRMMLAARKPS